MSEATLRPAGQQRFRRDDLSTRETQHRNGQSLESPSTTRRDPSASKHRSLQSMLATTKYAPSNRTLTGDGMVDITYNGYWWGTPVSVSLREDPFTIRPMLGLSPPNGRATITCEYDQDGLWDVKASYTVTESGIDSTRELRQNEPNTAVATTYGTGRVGGRKGRSRSLVFMTNFRGQIKSEISEHELCIFDADVYIEALGDWDSGTGSTERYRYDRDGKDHLH